MTARLARPMAHRRFGRGRWAGAAGAIARGGSPRLVLVAALLLPVLVAVSAAPLLSARPAGPEGRVVGAPMGAGGADRAVWAGDPGAGPGADGLDPVGLAGKAVIVAALLYLALHGLRRLQAGSRAQSRRLEVVESRALGPKASLHLVAIGDRRLLIGLASGGIVGLAELDAAELEMSAPEAAEARPDEEPAPGAGVARRQPSVAASARWLAWAGRSGGSGDVRVGSRTPPALASPSRGGRREGAR